MRKWWDSCFIIPSCPHHLQSNYEEIMEMGRLTSHSHVPHNGPEILICGADGKSKWKSKWFTWWHLIMDSTYNFLKKYNHNSILPHGGLIKTIPTIRLVINDDMVWTPINTKMYLINRRRWSINNSVICVFIISKSFTSS